MHLPCPVEPPLQSHMLAALLAALLTSTATSAGPLLDKLRERRETRAEQHAAPDENKNASAPNPATEVAQGVKTLDVPPGAKVLRDQAYGPHPRQRMDVYMPTTSTAAGVVFMVHGGAWRTGSKSASSVVTHKLQRWLPQGLAVVSIDYRLLPETPVAIQADDVRAALTHAQRHATQWGLPADRFVLMGHSAGAHLVALVSANPAPSLSGGTRPWLGTVVLDSSVMNVPAFMAQRHARLYDDAFGTDPAVWHANSPFHHLTPQAPPLLLVCSTKRPDLPCRQAQAFSDQAKTFAVRAEVLPQAKSHGEINDLLGQPGAYTQAVEAFMASLHPDLLRALRHR